MEEPRTFTETAVREAAARRTRVDLVLDPVTPGTDGRLISRLIGIDADGNLILDVPRTSSGNKVFVPAGWRLGLAFELADMWMQSRSVVVGHAQFPVRPARRVDALVVGRPERIISCNQRRRPRHKSDALKPVSAMIQAARDLERQGAPGPCLTAQLRDWSEGGLGLQLTGGHNLRIGLAVLVRVRIPGLTRESLFRGRIKHVTALGPEVSLIGVGDVREVPVDKGMAASGQTPAEAADVRPDKPSP